ncbi:MAG: sugar phosphate isomerase/epimerase family protein [Devosiaceae bacterium]
MRLTLCNEVIRELDFPSQCQLAADLGYDGLEVAPFTLSDDPCTLSSKIRRDYRIMAEDAGIAITGLHWLMNAPGGISLTSKDPAVQAKTRDHMLGLVELCHDLGGQVLVHGSPGQRPLGDADSPAQAQEIALGHWTAAGDAAEQAGLIYCIEPLAPVLTDFVNTVEQAQELLALSGSKGLKTMLDTSAAWGGESERPCDVLAKHIPSGNIAHIHFNESNRRAPGQGEHVFLPIVRVLAKHGYDGWIGIEPFDYHPDGSTAAALAAGYVLGLFEALHQEGSCR